MQVILDKLHLCKRIYPSVTYTLPVCKLIWKEIPVHVYANPSCWFLLKREHFNFLWSIEVFMERVWNYLQIYNIIICVIFYIFQVLSFHQDQLAGRVVHRHSQDLLSNVYQLNFLINWVNDPARNDLNIGASII